MSFPCMLANVMPVSLGVHWSLTQEIIGKSGKWLIHSLAPCEVALYLIGWPLLGPPNQSQVMPCVKIHSYQPHSWVRREYGFAWDVPGQPCFLGPSSAMRHSRAEATDSCLGCKLPGTTPRKHLIRGAAKPRRQTPFIHLPVPSS